MKQLFVILVSYLFFAFTVFGQNESSLMDEIFSNETSFSLELCKFLHQNPELSFQEFETSKRMAAEIEKIGFTVTTGFGGNNVVGVYKNGDGPVIMLRTDMDALPVQEKTGLVFASKKFSESGNGEKVAVMHACGHDIHMSVWLGTLRSLVSLKDKWNGTLLVIAQQAEEYSGGARLAVEKGLFKQFPIPDYALAYHINPELEAGTVGLISGPVFAGVKTVNITVFGKGGHGAYPEKCIDPVVIASRIVLDLQTIVSREISPLKPVVITVGSIHGGTRPNIIPDEVKMELTLRYYDEATIEKAISAIRRVCNGAAITAGMSEDKLPKVNVLLTNTPPVINNEILCKELLQIGKETLGTDNLAEISPTMAGEDFGFYGSTHEKIPICLIWLGCTGKEEMKRLNSLGENPAPLHSPILNPDYENTIHTGIKVMVANVLQLMKK